VLLSLNRTSSAGSEDDVATKGAFDCHGAVDAGVDGEGGGGAARRQKQHRRGQPHTAAWVAQSAALDAQEQAVRQGGMRV